MISFKQYLLEDIELFPSKPTNFKSVKFDDKFIEKTMTSGVGTNVTRHDMGDIHPDYSLHKFTHHSGPHHSNLNEFFVVHKPTNMVVSSIEGMSIQNRKTNKDTYNIIHVGVDPKHRKKKTGISLPFHAYEKLSDSGHIVRSDTLQTVGGAHLWNTIRKHPKLKDRVFMLPSTHESISDGTPLMIPAHNLKDDEIWSEGSIEGNNKSKKINATSIYDRNYRNISSRILELHPPK
jgi:hypothetical protein